MRVLSGFYRCSIRVWGLALGVYGRVSGLRLTGCRVLDYVGGLWGLGVGFKNRTHREGTTNQTRAPKKHIISKDSDRDIPYKPPYKEPQ